MTLVTQFHFGAHPGGHLGRGPRSGKKSWSQMVTADPMLISTMTGQRLTLAATGSWTAEHAYELEPLLEAVTERRLTAGGVSIDMSRISGSTPLGPGWSNVCCAHGGPQVTRPTSSGLGITTARCLKRCITSIG